MQPVETSQAEVAARPESPKTDPLLITARELSRRLSIGVRTIWRMVAAGELPQPIRFTRKLIRWHWPAVQARVEALARRQGAIPAQQ